MSYYCQDCSYRGIRRVHSGACPACGSFAIARSGTAAVAERESRGERARLVLLVLVWGALLALLLGKLQP